MTDSAQEMDLARLPGEVRDFLNALAPGDVLTVTRNGEPVATISAPRGPIEGTIISPVAPSGKDEADEPDMPNVTVVATAMELSETARATLSAELGADYIVLDMHAAPNTADVLLVPPISLQLLGGLKDMFPAARVIVAEIDDPELGVSYGGAVRRFLDAGAEVYLTSTTVPRLARQLGQAVSRSAITAHTMRRELESGG